MFNDSQAGMFGMLVGLIALVLGGVAISTAVDNRIKGGKVESDLISEISAGDRTIRDLEGSIAHSERVWEQQHAPRASTATRLRKARAEAAALVSRRQELDGITRDLQRENERIEAEFSELQAKTRSKVRAKLIGHDIGRFPTTTGRTYEDARLVGFTTFGVRIRHRHGSVTVDFKELTDDWKERILWEPSESVRKPVVAAPADEEDDLNTLPDARERTRQRMAERDRKEEERRQQVEIARNRFIAAKAAYLAAKRATSEARSQIDGPRRSPQGSLETWEERTAQLSKVEFRFRAAYDEARARLREVSPSDTLLYQR